MKRALLLLLSGFLVLTTMWLVGCGGGKAKVETEKGDVEVSSPKGSIKIESKVPTEAELGVPIYPNAEAVRGGSITTTEGEETYSAAVPLVTDDSVEKVIAWYRDELAGKPGLQDLTTPEGGMFAFQSGDEIKMISIGPGTSAENKGKTTINVMSGTGTMPFQTQ
jgi:hypothetical protein